MPSVFPTRSDTNWAEQSQEMARATVHLKFYFFVFANAKTRFSYDTVQFRGVSNHQELKSFYAKVHIVLENSYATSTNSSLLVCKTHQISTQIQKYKSVLILLPILAQFGKQTFPLYSFIGKGNF